MFSDDEWEEDDPDEAPNEERLNEDVEETPVEEDQAGTTKKKSKKKPPPPKWTLVDPQNSEREEPVWTDKLPDHFEIDTPIDYFRDFYNTELLQNIVDQSNLFSVQKNPNKPLNLTIAELEQFLGICIGMSVYDLPRARMYWANDTRIDKIANVMSRNRWEEIKSNIHCNDNTNFNPRDPNRDRLFKVRPLIDFLQEKFREIPKDQYICVDEQIVPYKGKSSLKQYNPKKPKKWGFKVFVLCDTTGLVYDFQIYCGAIQPVQGFQDIGASSNIVLKMVESVPRGKSYKLFFDNWFASLPLFLN